MVIGIFLGTLFSTLAIGTPIAFALLACGIVLMIHLDFFDAQIVAQNLIHGADSFPLLAVPFFLLAGEVMNVGGLSKRIVNVAITLVGHVRGGLGFVAILASVLLAALSGSAVADAAALASLLVPMMVRAGHSKERSCGLIASGGIIAPVIPPSIGFIVFGVASELSISKLFMAGIVPGILMALFLCIAWWLTCRKDNVEPAPRKSGKEILHAVLDSFWALLLPFIIIFGLKFGIFTPTEAAVVVAVYALFVALFIYKELKFNQLYDVFVTAAKTTSVVIFLVGAALVSSWMITVGDVPGQVVKMLGPFLEHKFLLLSVIMLLIVAVGTCMDMTPSILILTPVLMPIIVKAGINPIYFGVLFIINTSIGLITPPVGTVLNVVAGVGKVSMDDLVKGIWPFILAELLALLLIIIFPGLVTVPAEWFGGM
ncbi:TRAP transporter large permease subunit [Pelobacter seleniigenes]|uniref:TRAP transporter large permease subunit n=1 Tax=Pelobacter seleniigenes TaxID=407188 RepID=UPI0004A73CC6|nr:TRAP transporter large permease subunit [Pelobacter seleniigenes]